MIDPTEKQTQPLALEQQKRGRGRPATGQAMTPAEKQRAYRLRLAEQRTAQVPAVQLEKVRSTAAEQMKKLKQQVADAKAETAAANTRAEKAEKDLANLQKMKAGNVTKKTSTLDAAVELIQYDAQSWNTKARKWKTIGEDDPENQPFNTWKDAEKFVKEQLKDGSRSRYRIIPANLPVKEYK